MMDGRGGNCLYWFLAHPMVLVVVQLMVVAVGIAVEGRRRHDQNTLYGPSSPGPLGKFSFA